MTSVFFVVEIPLIVAQVLLEVAFLLTIRKCVNLCQCNSKSKVRDPFIVVSCTSLPSNSYR